MTVVDRVFTLAEAAGYTDAEMAWLRTVIPDVRHGLSLVPDRLLAEIRRVDKGMALRLIGRRAEIHPLDVFASAFRNPELADLCCLLNVERYGHKIAGRGMLDNGILTVVDIRPALARYGIPLTDPALPDNWNPRSQ